MKRVVLPLVSLLLLAVPGCGSAADPAAVTTTFGPAGVSPSLTGSCPPPNAEGNAEIDWVPFVRVGGLMFQATFSPESTVEESQLGVTVVTVACTIGDSVNNPDYRPRDGDAAFLPAGTVLRAVDGYRTDFRLAAREDGAWHVYEVDDVPDATTGADMLDLRGKVTAVHLVEGERGEKVLRTVDDPAEVATLVDAVLAAPVVAENSSLYDALGDESPVFVRFDMTDGTAVQRAWHVRAGLLWRRIEAPAALEEALRPDQP